MRRIWIFTVVLILLTGTGYLAYRFLLPKEQVNTFHLIPETASLIVETSDVQTLLGELKTNKSWRNIHSLPLVANLNPNLALLDSLMSQEEQNSFFLKKRIVASLHTVPPGRPGWLLYVPLASSNDETQVESLLGKVTGMGFKKSEQSYKDFMVYSLTSSARQISFTYLVYKNTLILSSSALLVLEVVNTISGKKNTFFRQKEDVREKEFLEGKVRVYLKYEKLKEVIQLVSNYPFLGQLPHFAKESILEFTFSDKQVLLNGYTFPSSEANYLDVIKGQKPQSFHVRNLIPNNALWVYYLGFDDAEKFSKELYRHWDRQDKMLAQEIDSLKKHAGIDLRDIYQEIGKEVALCSFPSQGSNTGKILLIHSKDIEKLYKKFEVVVEKLSAGKEEGSSFELSGNISGLSLSYKELPSRLFGRMFSGFQQSYIVKAGEYLIISETKEQIRNFMNDLETENVWGKTFEMTHLLEESISEFNIGLFVNLNAQQQEGRKTIGSDLLNWGGSLRSFDFLAIQFSDVGETVLTNMLLTHHLSETAKEESVTASDILLDNPLDQFFFLSGKAAEKDLIIQDSMNQIYYVTRNHTIKWKQAIPEKIVGEVYLADMDRDRDNDIVFATRRGLYAFTGEGKPLKRFPLKYEDTTTIIGFSIINYSGKSDYRLAASDRNGNVYLYNSIGESLEGWSPLALNMPLADKLRHVRVAGKDILVTATENGFVYAFNRRGEVMNNFPVMIDKKIISPVAIRKSNSLTGTTLNFVTEDSEYISVNLLGKVTSRLLLAGIKVLPEAKNNSFFIEKSESGKMVVMHPEAAHAVTMGNSGSTIHYYQCLSGGDVFLVNDQKANHYQVIDSKGNLLTEGSWKGEAQKAVIYNERKKSFRLYLSDQNRVEFVEF